MHLLRTGGQRRIAFGVAAAVLLSGSAAAAAGRSPQAPVVGPGPVKAQFRAHGYWVGLRLMPNTATAAAATVVTLSRGGRPVAGARINVTYEMLGMGVVGAGHPLAHTSPGRYAARGPVLGMGGRWDLRIEVEPPNSARFAVALVDQIR
jgi:hypothetical protein